MSHYFDENPAAQSSPEMVDVMLPDVAFTLQTDVGVFSHGKLDSGTRFLLQQAPTPPPAGNLLDLGAGSGAVAITLALRAPAATVWAVEVNRRALELIRSNAARAGVTNIVAVPPEEVPPNLTFAGLWSNPPIRIGKSALHELLLEWLGRLAERANAVIVVQKHLGSDSLQKWLNQQGFATERIASRQGFRLLQSSPRH